MKKLTIFLSLFAVFLLGTIATNAQVIVDGNPSCTDLNIGSVTNFRIQPPQAGVNTYAITGIGSVTTNVVAAPTNATPSVVSFNATSPFVRAFIVKAGNRANVYTYNPAVVAAVNLLSPIDVNGNFPGLSHLDVCYAIGTTAAHVTVSGRVLDSQGNPISSASVSTVTSDGTPIAVRANSFGYFNLTDLEVGHIYIVNVRAKGYTFSPSIVNVMDEVANLNIFSN